MIKGLEIKNLPEIVFLENETWPEGTRANETAFRNRLNIFPQGFIGFYVNNQLAGFTTSMIIDLNNINSIESWEKITDFGMITNHNENGNCLYIVSLGVSPRFQGNGVGQKLITEQINFAKKCKLEYVVLGSRIPGFHLFEGSIEDYLSNKTPNGFSIDPLVRFYQKSGLEIGSIKPNYMEDDKESRNYGLIMYKKLN